jgi:urease accessory protein
VSLRHVREWIPAAAGAPHDERPLALDLQARRRSRQRITSSAGIELAIALTPGTVLRDGDVLVDDHGARWRVQAQPQAVLRVRSDDPWLLQRAAYHLGNRHVPVAIARDALLLEPDPVLREMLERLGLQVEALEAPFEPESGAYGGGHRHGHDATFAEDLALARAVFARHEPVITDPHPHVRKRAHD